MDKNDNESLLNPGIHPVLAEVTRGVQQLEAAALSDEEDLEFSDDVDDFDDDVDVKNVKKGGAALSTRKSEKASDKSLTKSCKILLGQLVRLVEIQMNDGELVFFRGVKKFLCSLTLIV